MPLRAYFAGLTALFVIAAGAAVLYGRVQSSDDARKAALADARFAARLAAREIGSGLQSVQSTVAGAAANPGVAQAFERSGDCNLAFGGTDVYTSGHLDLVRTTGAVACSSAKGARTPDYRRASWLTRARREPLLLAPVRDPRTNKQVVLTTAPAPPHGFVLAVFDLDGLGEWIQQTYGGPRRLEFVLADARNATVLTRSTAAARAIGTPLRLDTRDRLYAAATVPGVNWRVHAGADLRQALAATRQLNHRELAIILVGLLLFVLATVVVHRRIARPLQRRHDEVESAYRVLFQGTPLPTWVHDAASRRILEVNDAAVAGYGYTREELLDKTVDDLEQSPTVHVRKDGTRLDVDVASHAIDFRGQEACVVIAEDITDKERLRAQLQQSQRLESLGQLAGGVAHDFNNLLAVILGYATFIERRAEPGSRDERDVAEIRKAGERASRLTRQLLLFARREVVRPRVLDLTGVVLEMEELLGRTLGEQVVLNTSLATDLWPIMADQGQLEQVLLNLVVNARDAMPDGGTLTIDTENIVVDEAYASIRTNLAPGSYVRLRVSDTGVGMDRATAARAFEPFFTTKSTGTGLGLATLHGIVVGAGGHVQIYSEPGFGTTFTVLLPTTDAPVPAPAGDRRAERGGGETILVVEDEPAMLEVTRRILAENGYEVLAAHTPAQAVALAERHPGAIDLLLTDVVMPDMLGNEVAERVRALRPGIAVLFMSGYAQPVVGLSGDIIDKPFTEAALLGRLHALLASRASP